MRVYQGLIAAVRSTVTGRVSAEITCPASAIPAAGRYILGYAPEAAQAAPLATPLFCSKQTPNGFFSAPPLPGGWEPGMRVWLRGPFGHGFRVPEQAHRLALVGLDESFDRLHPLLSPATGREIAIFSDALLPRLPAYVEAHPLSVLPESLGWPDYLAIDLPGALLAELPARMGLPPGGRFPCPAQVLVSLPMPCATLAGCGACAVQTHHGWKMACSDGPVFNADMLHFG